MTSYVLDTHTLIRWLKGSDRLPEAVRVEMETAERLYVSAASIIDSYYLTTKRTPDLTFTQWGSMVAQVQGWPGDAEPPIEVVPVSGRMMVKAAIMHTRPWSRRTPGT